MNPVLKQIKSFRAREHVKNIKMTAAQTVYLSGIESISMNMLLYNCKVQFWEDENE